MHSWSTSPALNAAMSVAAKKPLIRRSAAMVAASWSTTATIAAWPPIRL